MESSGNLSIDSIGNIVEHTSALEEQTDKPDKPSPTVKKQSSPERTEEPASPVILSQKATSKPWTENKRNTSCSYIKNIAYRRTTFSKKVKIMKKQADLSKQTGAQIKITIFNPDSKKTITYHTSNLTEETEPGNNVEIDVCDEVLEQQPPLIHSSFKGLNLPLLVDFHSEKGKEYSLTGAAALSPVINNLPRSSSTSSSKKKKVCRASTGKRPPGKLILRKEKQCENKERPGSPSKLIPKKSIFRETMKTLMQEQDHAEIRPKRQKQSSQVCAGCSVRFNTPRDKEILKDDKHDWIGCNLKSATIGDMHYVLELCLGKKILKKLICFVQYIRRVKTVFFIQTHPYLQVYSEKKAITINSFFTIKFCSLEKLNYNFYQFVNETAT